MSESKASYRQIFKATSLFGGVQLFHIIISIIRSKFVAVLLGPEGMGIAGLLRSTTRIIALSTNFGLKSSAVKNVAAAVGTGDEEKVSKVVFVLRRLVWITGTLGALVSISLAPWLSKITFGSKEYTFAFIWISITFLFQQLSAGQMVVLQGLRKLKYLANANLISALAGLVFSIPLYYIWGIDGIVPAIIVSSLTGMLIAWFFARKVKIKPKKPSIKESLDEGKDMVKLGITLTFNGLIVNLISYLLRIYISNTGGVDQVGLYTAGYSIVNTYVGMIFTAMGTDYYPRLASVAHDSKKRRKLINHQAELALLILAPIITVFLVFIKWIVLLLYSQKFIAINEMVHWAILGMLFKSTSWAIAYVIIAKGDRKLFFWNELIANSYTLGLNIIGYRVGGLEGLGMSFLASYILYFIQVYIVTNHKYRFSFSRGIYKIAAFQVPIVILCFISIKLIDRPLSFAIGGFLILLSVFLAYKELDKRIGIKELFQSRLKKNNQS